MSHLHTVDLIAGLELAGQALHTEFSSGSAPVKRLFPAGHSQWSVTHKTASPFLVLHFSSHFFLSPVFPYVVALHVNSVDPSHTANSGQTSHPL